MKKIECIIPQKKFPELEEKLRAAGICGMTISEVKGYGNQQTRPESYLILPKTKLEIYSRDEDVETIVEIMLASGQTDRLGGGKIAIFELLDLVRIRTGERGAEAV